jgi:predicted nucleic acid-binding protein
LRGLTLTRRPTRFEWCLIRLRNGRCRARLWRLEVGNSLTVAVRRGRIDVDFRRAALADLALLDIAIDQSTDSDAWGETLLADRFRLTLYDAAYLELARRRVLPLATLDGALCSAAMGLGVGMLGTG